jgi:hypothetical protein
MADPASLLVTVVIEGMDLDEGAVAFANLPAGATAAVLVTQPAIGGKRYRIEAESLSVQGAKDLTAAVCMHCYRVANGGSDG